MPERQQVMRDLTRVQLMVWRSASEMNWPYLWSTGSTKKLVWRHHQIQFLAYLTKSYSWSSKELEIMSALTKQSRISWDLAGRANESMSWQKTNACGSHFLPEVSLKSIRRSRKLRDKSGLAAGSFFSVWFFGTDCIACNQRSLMGSLIFPTGFWQLLSFEYCHQNSRI